MSSSWTWPGARWWKCDLHLHTPASHDFADKSVTPGDWLQAARDAGLDAVAVTDHNTNGWITQVQEAAREFPDLVVFPGVELTVQSGIHLLAIFDPQKTAAEVSALLTKCELKTEKYGRGDAVAPCSLPHALKHIASEGAVAIAAHVNDPKGLLREQEPGPALDQILTDENLNALEVNSEADISRPELLERRPRVSFSDAHRIEHIGTRATWIKMTRPSLEGLRLALLDGELSVRPDTDDDPNLHAELAIESITIRDAIYFGRVEPFELKFNPWLNTLIGGRGTGKSSVIEFLRIALRRVDELPEELKKSFDRFNRIPQSRDDKGVLTGETVICAVYRKDTGRFRLQWSEIGDITSVLEEQPDRTWVEDQSQIPQRFPVRIYSQKQIFELAESPEALLRILNEEAQIGFHDWKAAWDKKERNFLALRAKARGLAGDLEQRPQIEGELRDIKRKLRVFEESGHTDVRREYQRRLQQRRAVDRWTEEVGENGDLLRDAAASLKLPELDATHFDTDQGSEGHALLTETTRILERLEAARHQVLEIADQVDGLIEDWRHQLPDSSWHRLVDAAEKAYSALQTRLEEQGTTADLDEYSRLVTRRQALEERLKTLSARESELEDIERETEANLEELGQLRRELTRRRRKFLTDTLKDNRHVKIEIEPYRAFATVEAELRAVLGTDRFQNDIGPGKGGNDGLLGWLYDKNNEPDKEKSEPEAFEERLRQLKEHLAALGRDEEGSLPIQDQRFAEFLQKRPPETFDRLATWFPEDSLKVSYSPRADGNKFQPIERGSPGQKSAALLAFLLSYGQEPIILDQPEDDLDNQLIYDLIVAQLREIKKRRQVIVVTHNANIVVNADAELVTALDTRRGQSQIITQGGLQEQAVRDAVCKIMEGGREAFEKRYERIVRRAGDVR